ncbi:MAG: hypothetical protein JF597_30975 [Streptomyces sp.]|uniref:hypothetical protein n=1 Tax=Streptomyces sp. TaxID=1931 RepID=UPI0025EF8C05|nr:hypothetical protein [Streptomyces sp.]MBW8797851.1 hypothetical protein [Streptomyces sp.]
MSNEMPPAELPVVDEVLAGALAAQGEAGVRALGLLRDAHRVLTGEGFVRPAEVAAACVRSAADALLSLPGAPVTAGLKPAAKDLLAAVDALPPVAADSPSGEPAAGAANSSSGGPVGAGWERVSAAAEVLRGELERPGGFHRARARGIVERLTGVTLGAAQETALDVWGAVYGVASGILHGSAAGPGEAVQLYADLLGAAHQLLVPLPDRAAHVLELAALQAPGEAEVAELARWSDPRATDYFFRCGPAPAWLNVLQEHAPHLLMPDGAAGGRWPAAPFLGHVASADPDAARGWLAAPSGEGAAAVARAQQVAAAGRLALDGLLSLAVRHRAVVDAGQLRAVLAHPGVQEGGGAAVGATLHLAARWARTVPRAERTREWILVVEGLLAGAVDDEHAGHLSLRAVAERVATAEAKAKEALAARDVAAAEAVVAAAVAGEEEARELIAEETAARLPGHEVAALLRELACTAYPAGRAASAHPNITIIRAVLAGLLARDIALLPEASRPLVFGGDLDLVHAGDPAAYGGPRLARTVLDLAAADADAGVHLTERTRPLARVAPVDGRLHDRLLAAHLAGRPPAGGSAGQEWWEQAVVLVPRLLAAEPAPEPARLLDLVLGTCPPEHAVQLEADVRTALGTAPSAAQVAEVLPADAEQVDGLAEPLASWLRVWDWSPVLPARLLADWEPVLEAARRLKPAGSSDPRTAPVLEPHKATTVLDAEDLAEAAAGHGPAAAAAALAATDDAGAEGYAMVLHRLIATDPAAWTADVPAVLAALQLPELGAFYLAAAAVLADRPGTLSGSALTDAVTAVLDVRRRLDETTSATDTAAADDRSTAVFFADQALFDLITTVWRTDTALADDQEKAVLAHLHALAAPLACPAADPAQDTPTDGPGPAGGGGVDAALLGSDPGVRALGCLLEYAVHRARTAGEMPADVLQTVSGALPARGDQDAVATAIGVRLPALHRHAPDFAADHRTALYGLAPGRPSPADSWLRWGPYDRQVLAALERAELFAALRDADPGPAPGAAAHTAAVLLADPAFLGDPAVLWAELATGTGGADATGLLLAAIASRTPRTGGPAWPDAAERLAAAAGLWRAALAAGLPSGALASAGDFADTGLDEDLWLSLTRASAEHTPALTDADLVAERAARHPDSEDALLLAAQLVTHPAETGQDAAVRRHARALLDAAAARPAHEHPAVLRALREALVNSGDIDAAQA